MTVRLTIQDLDPLGRGLAVWEKKQVIVPNALIGEEVDAELSQIRGRDFGQVVARLNDSPLRNADECPHVESCPACTLRHGQAVVSRQVKSHRVTAAFSRKSIGIPQCLWLGSAPRNHYRTRAVARILPRSDGSAALGMLGRTGPIPLSECPVQVHRCREILLDLEADLTRLGLSAYDPQERRGVLRHVIVDAYSPQGSPSECSARVVLCLGQPIEHDWQENTFLRLRPEVAILVDILPFRKPGLLCRPQPLRHGPSVHFKIGGDLIRSTLPAWCPQSPGTVQLLRETAVSWLSPSAVDTVLEIGCGSGTMSLALARCCAHLVGLDRCRAAVIDAQHNADLAALENVEFRVGYAAKGIPRILNRYRRFDLALCHGMRTPFGPRAMSALSACRPRRILMISPSAGSLASDIEALPGYTVSRLGALDQTPGAPTVLTVALLTRNSRSGSPAT